MGFGDTEPPAMRADPFPATLQSPGGSFNLLILTFVSWDVLKITITHSGEVQHIQIDATGESTDFVYHPVKSGQLYSFVAKGCARAIDGSTNRCSPESEPLESRASVNTTSLRTFLILSGVDISSLRRVLPRSAGSLRAIMGL